MPDVAARVVDRLLQRREESRLLNALRMTDESLHPTLGQRHIEHEFVNVGVDLLALFNPCERLAAGVCFDVVGDPVECHRRIWSDASVNIPSTNNLRCRIAEQKIGRQHFVS